MGKDALMACIVVLPQKLSGSTEENVDTSLRKAGLQNGIRLLHFFKVQKEY
jgi:hypothetical protein